MNKQAFVSRLQKRIPARWHMSLIGFLTISSGILLSKSILYFELLGPAFRYSLSVAFAYAMFFGMVYIWIRLYGPGRARRDRVDFDPDISSLDIPYVGSPSRSPPSWSGGGGKFSGGGASSSWDSSKGVAVAEAAQASKPSGIFDSVGDADDLGEGLVFVLIAGLVIAALSSTAYVVYLAPEILFEAAFEAAVVAGIYKKAKNMQTDGWALSVFKKTWWVFGIVFLVALIVGFYMGSHCPGVMSFKQFRETC